jgi:hypothetical protein
MPGLAYAHGALCPRRPMPTEAYAHEYLIWGIERLYVFLNPNFWRSIPRKNNTGCGKLRDFSPERKAKQGTSVPVFFLS